MIESMEAVSRAARCTRPHLVEGKSLRFPPIRGSVKKASSCRPLFIRPLFMGNPFEETAGPGLGLWVSLKEPFRDARYYGTFPVTYSWLLGPFIYGGTGQEAKNT